MSDETQNTAMDADLAEAYRQLRDHVAGSDLLNFLDVMEEIAIESLSIAPQDIQVFRAQGYLAGIRDVKSRFLAADEVLRESIENLKP